MTEMKTDTETIRKFLNFDIGWSDVCQGYDDIPSWEGECRIAYTDVLNALYRMQERHVGVIACDSEYIQPLIRIADRIHLCDAIGYPGRSIQEINWNEALGRVPFKRESTLFSVLAYMYHEADMLENGEDRELIVDDWIEMMENTLDNELVPMSQWQLSGIQQMHYIMYIHENNLVDYIDDDERELFGKCLDAMCDQGVYAALRIQADCCAGGNMAYDCDWDYAREVYEILVSEQEDIYAALMAGRIWLEGTSSDGTDYEKAWKYLSMASMAHVHAAMLSCAEMLRDGKGVPVNRMLAVNMARDVYEESRKAFTDHYYGTIFADAAIFIGDCYRDGIGGPDDPMMAMSYYLDAENALKKRLCYAQFVTDEDLMKTLQEKIETLQNSYGALFTAVEDSRNDPLVLDRLLSGNNELSLRVENNEEGTVLEVTRLNPNDLMLLTMEQMMYSALLERVRIQVPEMVSCSIGNGEAVLFDRITYDEKTGTTSLWYRGAVTGSIRPDVFVFRDEMYMKDRLAMQYTFAAVRLSKEDKVSFYLADHFEVKHGDRVIVEERGRMVEGTVAWTFRSTLAQMPHTADPYTHILRVAEDNIVPWES